MPRTTPLAALALAGSLIMLALPRGVAADAPPLKVGFVSTFSGFMTEEGQADDAAIAAFIKEHGDSVAGRKLQIIKRDDGGNGPDQAKRLAQELIVNDHVDFLMGQIFTPNARAVGDVSTSSKVPDFYLNGGYGMLENRPYTARFGFAQGQLLYPLAQWARKSGIKNVALIYLDFSSGHDAATSFKDAFTAAGGTISSDIAVPMNATDFSAYIAAHSRCETAGRVHVPHHAVAAVPQAMAQHDGREERHPAARDDRNRRVGAPDPRRRRRRHHQRVNYSAAHDSKLNKQFTKDMLAADPHIPSPDFLSVAVYDALQAIYKVVAAQNGNVDPEKTMSLVRGMKFESPRGPVEIDPQTRDIIQNIYIRRVDKINGVYQNTEIAVYPHVRDPFEK